MTLQGERFDLVKVLIGKEVITNRGNRIGTISDLIVDSDTGELKYLLVNIYPGSKFAEKMRWRNEAKLPINSLLDVNDVVLVDEKIITYSK